MPRYNKSKNTKRKNNETKSKFRSAIQIYNRLTHDKTLHINLNNVKMGYNNNNNQISSDNQEKYILDWVMSNKGGDIPIEFCNLLFCSLSFKLFI